MKNIKHMLWQYPPSQRIIMKLFEYRNMARWRLAYGGYPGGVERLIAEEYEKNTGEKMRIPPVSYTEKIQFAKLYGTNRKKCLLSDKYYVRRWVRKKIGEEYLIPLLGKWDHFEDIDFDSLPSRFVLKTTHASGTNMIVLDKGSLNYRKLRKQYAFWMSQNWAFAGEGFEMHYEHIRPRIIAEKYMEDSRGEFNDYKFLCFNGRPRFVWEDVGRRTNHRRNVYDLKWNFQPWRIDVFKNTDVPLKKPENFEKMIELAGSLCKGFDQVRVDLYNVDGKIYFGEMTFTSGKGYELIDPPEANDMLGSLWKTDFRAY